MGWCFFFLRTFSVVYCTSVESDIGKVISTNRGRVKIRNLQPRMLQA